MIPYIIHLGWLGSDTPQEKMFSNIQAYRDLNPEYEIYCWFSSEEIGLKLRERFSGKNISINNIRLNPDFKNSDLVQEQLDMGNPLGGANILILDLMVHYGGYWFDLGFTPTTPISSVSLPKAEALCELDNIPSVEVNGRQLGLSERTNGCYHFHASIKGGELYSLAQRLQREIIDETKKDEGSFSIFSSGHPAVKYQATKNTMGLTVFLATDCLVLEKYGKSQVIASCKASLFGTPKDRNTTYYAIPEKEGKQLQTYLGKAKSINQQILQREMLRIMRASPIFFQQTFFSLSQLQQDEQHLKKEAETLFKTDPKPINSTLIEFINKKQYSLALRKACAEGECSFVKLLMKYSDKLKIDLQQTSSNGNTALMWLEKSKASDKEKQEIKLLLSTSSAATQGTGP